MQGYLMLTDGPNRLLQEHLPPVDLDAELVGQCLGDILRGDRAVEVSLTADAGLDREPETINLIGDRLLLSFRAFGAPLFCSDALLGVLDAPRCSHLREAPRNQAI